MRERGYLLRDEGDPVPFARMERPRPNRLSDEARPNVLTGDTGEVSSSNAAPSWVGAAAAARRRGPTARRIRVSRPAGETTVDADGSEAVRAGPNWFTIIVVGFILINFLRACLQLG
jgi:hypothetical protein